MNQNSVFSKIFSPQKTDDINLLQLKKSEAD